MMDKFLEISGVWKFINQGSNSNLYFLNKDKYLSVYRNGLTDIELNDIKCEVAEKWREGYLINECIYFKIGDKAISLFDNGTYKVSIMSDDELFIKSLDFENEKVRYGIYNFPAQQTHWLNKIFVGKPRSIIERNFIVSTTDDSIAITNLNDGREWKYLYTDLLRSSKAVLRSQILSIKGRLFFVIDGNDNRGLFVFDIETGELLKKFDGPYYEIFQDDEHIYTTQFENVLCRINNETLELEEWYCSALIKEIGFESIHDHRCAVINGKICFTQSLGDNKAKLGVLDWGKRELVYKFDFEPQSGAIGSIQASESRIFVQTQDNILHIFEKRVN